MALIGFPETVNEKAARVVATGVVVLALATLISGWYWLAVIMAVGFALRVLAGPRYSPLGLLATKIIAPRLGAAKLVPGPPKRFAQAVGLVFTVAASVLALGFGAVVPAAIVMGVLLIFASLEAFAGFCAGCWVFARLMRLGLIPESTCSACADWRPSAAPVDR